MNNENISNTQTVPYIVYESAMTRAERNAKRLTIALVIAILLMFLSNALWLYGWCQYDYVSEETSTVLQQDGEGVNIIGDNNEANNGTVDNQDQEDQSQSAQER